MSEKSVVKRGPRCGFSLIEIQDENGQAIGWEIRGEGGRLIEKCPSLAAAFVSFQAMVDKVNNGLLLPGGGDAQKQEDPVEPSEPTEVDVPK